MGADLKKKGAASCKTPNFGATYHQFKAVRDSDYYSWVMGTAGLLVYKSHV